MKSPQILPWINSRGETPESRYRLVSALFLRLLGVIYLIAFYSIATQILGLVGSEGIRPIADQLAALYPLEITTVLRKPTLFWLNAGDAVLQAAAWTGCVAALLIILGRWQRTALVAAYVLYLSIYQACQPFLNFQWDGLLLESGFLAIFLTPHSRVVVLLFRWLLFRLRFMSGLSKLTFGDPTWPGLTALDYYFHVQPLPTPLAWYADKFPEWLLRIGTAGTLLVELVVPLMMFLPRRWRQLAAGLTIFWQLLIILTSNHNWINFLTIALCLFLLDDRALERLSGARLKARLIKDFRAAPGRGFPVRLATGVLAGSVIVLSALHFWELVKVKPLSAPLGVALDYAEAYRVVNKYHVFPTMKTERIELEIWGSVDGEDWRRYEFKYKPGPLDRPPPVVLPLQPRLDWQMWFVTLGPVHLPWFHDFMRALLNNSPAVLSLLENNPFPEQKPGIIRVYAFRYRFSDPEERQKTGQWWVREALGPFDPLPWVVRGPP